MRHEIKRIIGLVAHVDAGKTTLSERLLLKTGGIARAGEVHDGAAAMDSRALERAHGVTISAAAATVEWRDARITLVDTPGHIDFAVEVARSLRVIDSAIVVLSGVAGVEPQTEAVWAEADAQGAPRMAFVNKMDAAGADFDAVLADLDTRLSAAPAAIARPWFEDGALVGVLDVLGGRAIRWIDGAPETVEPSPAQSAQLAKARAALVEAVVLTDEAAFDRYGDGSEPMSNPSLRSLLRAATLRRELTPVSCGSAYRGVGVEPLLDAVVDLLPAPDEREALDGLGSTGPETRARRRDAPTAALVAKIAPTRFGEAAWLRVFAGRLAPGDVVARSGGGDVRIGRLCSMIADRLDPVDAAEAGDVVAAIGLKGVAPGETLSDPAAPLRLPDLEPPEPVIEAAIEPLRGADRDKLDVALRRLARADGALKVGSDPETGELLIRGAGELQLQLVVEALAVEHGLEARLGAPRVALREALAASTTVAHRLRRQTGGSGLFADVTIAFEPAPAGAEGLTFESAVVGGAVPAPFVAAVEKGLRESMAAGGPEGWPVLALSARLVDGAVHAKDSSALAFELAAREALKRAFAEAGGAILEPMARLDVRCPSEHVGAVSGDLAARRARIVANAVGADGRARIEARAPLANLAAYVGALRSLTQGRGAATIRPDGYAEAPSLGSSGAGSATAV